MPTKFLVRGPDRTAQGWPYHWVASRGWGKDPIEIEVVDGDEPMVQDTIEGQPVLRPDTHKLSRASFEELQRDPQMSIRPVDAAGEAALTVDVGAMVAENEKLKAENAGLQDTVKHLNKRIEELTKELDEATKPQGTPVLVKRKKD